ncbi:MAG: hypothetical protein AB1782_00905 [Cyanobacteriota bacterium]
MLKTNLNHTLNRLNTDNLKVTNKAPKKIQSALMFSSAKINQPQLNRDIFISLNKYHSGALKNNLTFTGIKERLVSNQQKLAIHDIDKASTRIQGLSRYLQLMVGFVPPDNRCGKEWFELGCTYLIKGSAGINIPEIEYPKYAKEFWELMNEANTYWTSAEFINHLESINTNPGVNASIRALKEIKSERSLTKKPENNLSFSGLNSGLLNIKYLLNDGCPYTNEPYNGKTTPSLDHILPHSAIGEAGNIDYNYIISSARGNSLRGDIPIVEFIRGWDADEYNKTFPDWKENLTKKIMKSNWLQEEDIIPFITYKTSTKALSQPNPNLTKELQNDPSIDVHNYDLAAERIKNLSNYLIKMVGFTPPGGNKEWFEAGAKYIILGTMGTRRIPKAMYPEVAEKFWGLMAKADNYWTSDSFLRYLESINNDIGVTATIEALKNIKRKNQSSHKEVSFKGSRSDLRLVKELLSSCAYSGEPMSLTQGEDFYPTVEHICPNNAGGGSNDYNYVLTLKSHNNDRSNMPLYEFLLGWNAAEFREAFPKWKSDINLQVHKFHQQKKLSSV